MPFTQENRLLSITTPLGEDALFLQGLTGQEGMSQLFSFELDLFSEDPAIAFDQIMGQQVTIAILLADGSKRYMNGIVNRFSQSGRDARFTYYQAEVVPWLWLLTRSANCRIFQNQSIPDIIKAVFQKLGFTDFKFQLRGSYEPREYCVQYRETDFNFVSRLMEQYGMFYFFEHSEDNHVLVVADTSSIYQVCAGQPEARCDYSEGGMLDEDVITSWQKEQELRPGKYAMADFNFETPSTSLAVNTSTTMAVNGNTKYEIYDYPGEYLKKSQGEDLVKIRMEEEESLYTVLTGASDCRAFLPGYTFALKGHDSQEMNRSYVITTVQHSATIGETYTSGEAEESTYANSFTCIPDDLPYRPTRLTPKPIVQGPQTAIVVGPGGEEIFTDKYGRVKVQFHWDREGKQDENSSCWIRVSHPWAGKGWGAVSIPRIGQEVIVDFLEGDPDQPIITGRVYNAEQTPPYGLPANMTQSGIKSRSSKGGGAGNFNEIRFEDKMGSEEMYIHAEKDQNTVVENDQNTLVQHDQNTLVENDRNQTITANKTIEVGANHTERIGSNMVIDVGGSKTETVKVNSAESILVAKELSIGGLYQITVGAAMNETVGGAKAEEIAGYKVETIGRTKTSSIASDSTETIGGGKSVSVSKDFSENVGGKHSEIVKKEYTLKAKKVTIEAEDEISLIAGKSTIVIKKNGEILIKGKDVNMQGSGKVNIKASGEIKMKGSKIKEN